MTQHITVVNGSAYGVVGADIHVHGDGTPVYVLAAWAPPPETDDGWLRELPSRMLNARFGVVPFTGRVDELEDLRLWRGRPGRLSARWLHAPGGQGKTRLAGQFAVLSRAEGWKVVEAVHGSGAAHPSPGGHDMATDDAAGLLLIVDYADRWPLSHLRALLGNALLHRPGVLTRVLFLARTDDGWPSVRALLANLQASTSRQPLPPVDPAARAEMFRAARDGFARRYGLTDPSAAALGTVDGGQLDAADRGLVLALHMAALVAVDAHVTGRRPPQDMAGLTVYLLDREHLARSESGDAALAGTAGQVVFVAALTGAVPRADGRALLDRLGLPVPSDRLLDEHAATYPATGGQVLEPMYPDRLAEDLLALSLPGHPFDYPARPWAASILPLLLDDTRTPTPGAVVSRAVTFLAAAAQRWPHVGGHLFPLLRDRPGLLLRAGNAAIAGLTAVENLDLAVLEAVEPLLPAGPHADLDAGVAAVVSRLTGHHLATTDDPARQGRLHGYHGWRLSIAGHHEAALVATTEAATRYRRLSTTDPDTYLPVLAAALNNIGTTLAELGRRADARAPAEEAVAIRRRLAARRDDMLPTLALALNNLGTLLWELGHPEDAVAPAQESIEIRRRLLDEDPERRAGLASSLMNLGLLFARLGRLDEALTVTQEAESLYRRLVDDDAAAHLQDHARSLNNLGSRLAELDRFDEALGVLIESVALRRRLAAADDSHLPALAAVLGNVGNVLASSGRPVEALDVTAESARLYRRLAAGNPRAHLPALAMVLGNLGSRHTEQGDIPAALEAADESLTIRRQLFAADPDAHLLDLAGGLTTFASVRAAGRIQLTEAMGAVAEAIELYQRHRSPDERRLQAAQRVRDVVAEALHRATTMQR